MFNYYCLNPIAKIGLDIFDETYVKNDTAANADCILVRSAAMHEMELPASLLAVSRAGAGVNNIPLDKCAEKGIVVFNTPGANANAVKELVLAAMLYASRDIVGGIEWCKANKDDSEVTSKAEKEKKKFAGNEIIGKKLGVIGLGAIGAQVANMAIKLGMEVYGYDPYISINAAWNISRHVHHVTDINEIYTNCDYITLHVPALDSTKGMISKDAISKMKSGVVVLNFARDILVDEVEMVKNTESGKVKYYISDFPNNTVLQGKNCIVTPHLGASTEEAEDNCAMMAVRELRDYLENGNITNSVNYPSINMGICQTVSRVSILHKNIAGMIRDYTQILMDEGANIASMENKSKGDYAYTLIDLDSPITMDTIKKLESVENVYKVRQIK